MMSIILELRDHRSHAGKPLVHPTSEDVVLSNVFGAVKNLSPTSALIPWLCNVTHLDHGEGEYSVNFWEKQSRPVGVREGNTIVDLVIEPADTLTFVEVKMDAPASSGTTHDPNRNQLVRKLDVGYCRSVTENKRFTLIFLTPDALPPSVMKEIRSGERLFPANPSVVPQQILSCLHWAPWASVGDAVADAYIRGELDQTGRRMSRDLLAYLALKGLWENRLPDEPILYRDKLYRPLRRDGSPFSPYASRRAEQYQGWREKFWDENSLREFLNSLRLQDKALLKVLADANGAMRQDALMQGIPMLRGKSSASLRALKSHINGACKQLDRAPLLSWGSGTGPSRIHEINPLLGALRAVVMTVARSFEIDWRLLEPTGS